MSEFPSLPLFTDAYLADTRHLSAQEHGAYLLLLMMAWRLPNCRLPDDDTKLSKWAAVDARTWKRIKPTVMAFWTLAEAQWDQARLSREREYVSKRADVARENGKQGGRPKTLNSNGSDNPTGSTRVTQPKAPNPIPSPTIEPQTERATNAARATIYDRLIEAAGARGPCNPNLAMGILPITDLITEGFDLEADVLPVVRDKARPDIGSWKFFVPAIRQRAAERAAAPPRPLPLLEDWPGRVAAWNADPGSWIHAWGPKPDESGCRAPAEFLRKAAA